MLQDTYVNKMYAGHCHLFVSYYRIVKVFRNITLLVKKKYLKTDQPPFSKLIDI